MSDSWKRLNNKSRNSKFSKIKIDNPVIDNLSVNTIGVSGFDVTFNSDIDVTNHDISVKDIRAKDVSSTKIETSVLIINKQQVYNTTNWTVDGSATLLSVSAENFSFAKVPVNGTSDNSFFIINDVFTDFSISQIRFSKTKPKQLGINNINGVTNILDVKGGLSTDILYLSGDHITISGGHIQSGGSKLGYWDSSNNPINKHNNLFTDSIYHGGNVGISGNVDISGNITVDGSSSFKDGVNIDGQLIANKLKNDGGKYLSMAGGVANSSVLAINRMAYNNNNDLDVSGVVNIDGQLIANKLKDDGGKYLSMAGGDSGSVLAINRMAYNNNNDLDVSGVVNIDGTFKLNSHKITIVDGRIHANGIRSGYWDISTNVSNSNQYRHHIYHGGNITVDGSHNSIGKGCTASGQYSTAMGFNTTADGSYSVAMGFITDASGNSSTAMGASTTASGQWSTAMGGGSIASGSYSTAMGNGTQAIGTNSFAMGDKTYASGTSSTAMGSRTTASGQHSTAMGYTTSASGSYSTAMGFNTDASGNFSTAMGNTTIASGQFSTAMGASTTASGDYSFAMGYQTTASGDYSVAMGNGAYAGKVSDGSYIQFAVGTSKSLLDDVATDLSNNNSFVIYENGDVNISGNVTIGKTTLSYDNTPAVNKNYDLDVSGIVNIDGQLLMNKTAPSNSSGRFLSMGGGVVPHGRPSSISYSVLSINKTYVESGGDIDLDVSGVVNIDGIGILRVGGNTVTGSDDRIKHNEKEINGIEVIKQLRPLTYFKSTQMYDENHNYELDENGKPITNDTYTIETGLIAQDLLKIEELKDYVSGGDRVNEKGETIKDKYSVAYNNIFVYGLQAIKEIIAENESLKSEVNNLKTEIESIKAHLNMNS